LKTNKLNIIIVLGLLATVSILIAQLLWTRQAFTLEEKKFSQKVQIALLGVVKQLYKGTNPELTIENPIKKISNDYYVVNIENDFDAEILEFYLKKEFKKVNLLTDFEYAMYRCESDEMVYGNYIAINNKTPIKKTVFFPKHKNLVYYFSIRFPSETTYLFSSLKFWFVLSLALILVLAIYVYSIYTIIQQRKYAELQRDFINNMTHEFKTPLASILIAANYLKQQNSIPLDQKLEKYVQIIINQSKKLNHHVEKVLTVEKWDNFTTILDKKELNFNEIVTNVIENISLQNPNVDIKFQTNSVKNVLFADAFHLSNMLFNLLENAIKYGDEKPAIRINISKTDKHLKLEIIDNGIGIPKENLPYIFDKFYRVQNLNHNKTTGFGLGLYYVSKVCHWHQWKIEIKNNTNKGITVAILI
jgi:two-component system phosphate regulon sensor histidine kinase PhoR